MDAFDADVLIYAGSPEHPLGRRVRALFPEAPGAIAGVGSVLLLPEVLAKPMRDGADEEVGVLAGLLSRLEACERLTGRRPRSPPRSPPHIGCELPMPSTWPRPSSRQQTAS